MTTSLSSFIAININIFLFLFSALKFFNIITIYHKADALPAKIWNCQVFQTSLRVGPSSFQCKNIFFRCKHIFLCHSPTRSINDNFVTKNLIYSYVPNQGYFLLRFGFAFSDKTISFTFPSFEYWNSVESLRWSKYFTITWVNYKWSCIICKRYLINRFVYSVENTNRELSILGGFSCGTKRKNDGLTVSDHPNISHSPSHPFFATKQKNNSQFFTRKGQ